MSLSFCLSDSPLTLPYRHDKVERRLRISESSNVMVDLNLRHAGWSFFPLMYGVLIVQPRVGWGGVTLHAIHVIPTELEPHKRRLDSCVITQKKKDREHETQTERQ